MELNRVVMVDKRGNATCVMSLARMEIGEHIAIAPMAMSGMTGRMIVTDMIYGAIKEEATVVTDMQRTSTIAHAGTEVAVREETTTNVMSTKEAEGNSLLHATDDVPCTFLSYCVKSVATWLLRPLLTSRPCGELKEITANRFLLVPKLRHRRWGSSWLSWSV